MPERADRLADTLIVGVGAALVAAGGYGVNQQLAVIWVHEPAPEWWGMAAWALGLGLLICLVCLILGMRGRGFTSLPASAGSLIGTLVALVIVGKLLIRDVRLGHGMACEVAVASIDYAPQANARRPYLITTTVQKILRGGVEPEVMTFRVAHQDNLRVGSGLRLEYTKPRQWTDLRTWFRRKVRHALDEAISVSVQ